MTYKKELTAQMTENEELR